MSRRRTKGPLPMRTPADLFDSAHLPEPDITEQLHELRRELLMRATVYPALIRAGRLTEQRAILQNHRMAFAIARLESLRNAERDLALIMSADPAKDPPAGSCERCGCPYCPN